MKKRILSLLLALTLVVGMLPVNAWAEGAATITVSNRETYAGNSFSITVSAQNLDSLASLDFTLYYDADVMTVDSTSNGNLLSNAIVSVNRNIAGRIALSMTHLDGISGSGTLLTVNFTVSQNAEPGEYPVRLTVGDAYDTFLDPVTIRGTDGKVTVKERTQTAPSFYLYSYPDRSTVQKGDVVTINLCSSYGYPFSSADFTVEFDRDLFQVETVTLSNALAVEGAVYSINTSIAGMARVVCANSNSVATYNLLTVTLKVIADVETYTTVTTAAANVYKEDLQPYAPVSYSCGINLKKAPEVVDYTDLTVQAGDVEVGQQYTASVVLEAGSQVAAADFVVSYDPEILRVESVSAGAELNLYNGMIMTGNSFDGDHFKFSYINESAYSETDLTLITFVFTPISGAKGHYTFTLSGTGVKTVDLVDIILEYKPTSGCVFVPTVTLPTCTAEGYTTYTCQCGESYRKDTVAALGHDYTQDRFCCSVCGEERLSYVVSFLDHDGTVLSEQRYLPGDTVVAPADPVRPADLLYAYSFAGWDKEIVDCNGDATYVATYTSERIYIIGDINADGAVTDDDAVYLLLHTMFDEANYPIAGAPADFDGNGNVTQEDAVYLLLHTLFGEMFYPLNITKTEQ